MQFYTFAQRWGNTILHRFCSVENGVATHHIERVDYTPPLYIHANGKNKASGYTDLDGNPLAEIREGDIRSQAQMAKDFIQSNIPVFGNSRFQYTFLDETYPGVDGVEFDSKYIKIAVIDIETECENGFPDIKTANEAINAITVYDVSADEYLVFTTLDYKQHQANVRLFKFTSEETMLVGFSKAFAKIAPNILTGWYLRFFDVPYIVNRMKRILKDEKAVKALSPFNRIEEDTVEIGDKQEQTYKIIGVEILDYRELYKKYTYHQLESYSLNFVSQHELGDKKIEIGDFHLAYKNDPQKFIEYNIHDVALVKKLDDKLKFIDLALTIAYDAKVNYTDVYAQVSMWDTLTINYLRNVRKVVVPFAKKHAHKTQKFEGAYVADPIPGLYDWVISFDVNSLYPSLIMALNISPEKIIGKMTDGFDIQAFIDSEDYRNSIRDVALSEGVSVGANGAKFNRMTGSGFLPEILDAMYEKRKKQKKIAQAAKARCAEIDTMLASGNFGSREMDELILERQRQAEIEVVYEAKQMATKINLNSCFGVLGNPYFRWYDLDQAEGITISGQLVIRWISHKIDEMFNGILKTKGVKYAIYGDTDSVYVDFSAVAARLGTDEKKIVDGLDHLAKTKIEPKLTQWFEELCYYLGADANRLVMKREAIGPAVFLQKKNYVVKVYDNEGVRYAEPKLKIMGLAAVRSSTPAFCRKKIKEAVSLLIDTRSKDKLDEFIAQTREMYYNLPIEDRAENKGITDMTGWIGTNGPLKGAPYHVKAAYYHNKLLLESGADKAYQKIRDGDKVKIALLHKQNKYHIDAIAFIGKLPPEFGLHKYADTERMFELHFLDPVMRVVDTLGWTTSTATTLDSFFG